MSREYHLIQMQKAKLGAPAVFFWNGTPYHWPAAVIPLEKVDLLWQRVIVYRNGRQEMGKVIGKVRDSNNSMLSYVVELDNGTVSRAHRVKPIEQTGGNYGEEESRG